MRLDYLKKRKELVSVALFVASVVLAVLILVKVVSFFTASARAENIVKRAVALSSSDPTETQKYLSKSREVANELKKENLFAPPSPKQHPVKEVPGIFGDEVLIDGKWYKVGDMVGDAKIVAINPTAVTIEWDGKEKTFFPIQATMPEPPKPQQVAAKEEEREGEAEEERGEVVVAPPEGVPMFERRGGFGEGFMAMRERFENMSEEERRAMREQMRERFSAFGGRRGRGGRRGEEGGR